MPQIPVPVLTIGLLVASNVFMTFAWYGHLKFKTAPLVTVILVSWGIAFFRIRPAGAGEPDRARPFLAAQLKTIQEVITLSVFVVFSWCLPERAGDLEPHRRLCLHRHRGLVHLYTNGREAAPPGNGQSPPPGVARRMPLPAFLTAARRRCWPR
jgi:uncharacterized protein (DUF486 family)